jgi:uncharacterized protein YjbI with pentapeptide repeats
VIHNEELGLDKIEAGQDYQNCHFLVSTQKIRIADVNFVNCTFEQTDFSHSEWLDCSFKGINFSNKHFEQSIFYRDKFDTCNLLGVECFENTWKDTQLSACRADYINFSSSKMTHCQLQDSSFKEALFYDVVFKSGLLTTGCTFDESSFSGSKLKGVDLSKSEFTAITFTPAYLQGLIINQFQAASLIATLGVEIR